MARTVNAVTSYTHTTVDIFFPNGEVCCEYCPLLETYARKQCRRTGEYLLDTHARGLWCPLQIDEQTTEVIKE